MRVAILVFPGSNCDRDMMVAVEKITGRRPALVWHKDSQMDPVDLIILPGGFSFGDYLRCGALAARAPVVEAMLDHASRGGAVLGVCNGFQILLETGLLPGTLIRNERLKFVCRSVNIQLQPDHGSPLLSTLNPGHSLTIPVAHNEGNYFAQEDDLEMLKQNGQIAFKYTASPAFGPDNPNGATDGIAGILSANRRVLGMMPHPERAIGNGHPSSDGKLLLSSIMDGVA